LQDSEVEELTTAFAPLFLPGSKFSGASIDHSKPKVIVFDTTNQTYFNSLRSLLGGFGFKVVSVLFF